MVLHRSNIEIPARFSFRPYSVQWEVGWAELMGWPDVRVSDRRDLLDSAVLTRPGDLVLPLSRFSRRERVIVRIEAPEQNFDLPAWLFPAIVEMYRTDVPSELLASHENPRTSPDISGRSFPILVCSETAFRNPEWTLEASESAKNAWLMRDEFLNLGGTDDRDWLRNLRAFLNRWGLWDKEFGFHARINSDFPGFVMESPGLVIVSPHTLWTKREEFRKSLASRNARKWLSTAPPLSFLAIDKAPYFVVERSHCREAIEATITIDHLGGRRFGFCKRCGRLFERETRHKKEYCSRRCIQAAAVQRWRDNQPKTKGRKRNAKG